MKTIGFLTSLMMMCSLSAQAQEPFMVCQKKLAGVAYEFSFDQNFQYVDVKSGRTLEDLKTTEAVRETLSGDFGSIGTLCFNKIESKSFSFESTQDCQIQFSRKPYKRKFSPTCDFPGAPVGFD